MELLPLLSHTFNFNFFFFIRRGDVPENTRFAAAGAGDSATFAAPEGSPRSADALLALGSPKAAVARPSGHGGFSSMGMLEWISMSYNPVELAVSQQADILGRS